MNHPEIQLRFENRVAYADSRLVAAGFGIEHKSLAKSLSEHFSDLKSLNLSQSALTGGRPERVYLLTERQVMLLPAICKPTDQLKAFQERLVDAFIRLREQFRAPQTALEQWITPEFLRQIAAELEAKNARIAALEPKADQLERLTAAPGAYSMAASAQILGIGRTRLFEWVRGNHIFEPAPSRRPLQRFVDRGYFVVRTKQCADGEVRMVPLVTAKGLTWLAGRLGITLEPAALNGSHAE